MNTVWTTEKTGKVIERNLVPTYGGVIAPAERNDRNERFFFTSPSNQHLSIEEARKFARAKIDAKISSLRKQVAKLEAMTIEEVPLP